MSLFHQVRNLITMRMLKLKPKAREAAMIELVGAWTDLLEHGCAVLPWQEDESDTSLCFGNRVYKWLSSDETKRQAERDGLSRSSSNMPMRYCNLATAKYEPVDAGAADVVDAGYDENAPMDTRDGGGTAAVGEKRRVLPETSPTQDTPVKRRRTTEQGDSDVQENVEQEQVCYVKKGELVTAVLRALRSGAQVIISIGATAPYDDELEIAQRTMRAADQHYWMREMLRDVDVSGVGAGEDKEDSEQAGGGKSEQAGVARFRPPVQLVRLLLCASEIIVAERHVTITTVLENGMPFGEKLPLLAETTDRFANDTEAQLQLFKTLAQEDEPPGKKTCVDRITKQSDNTFQIRSTAPRPAAIAPVAGLLLELVKKVRVMGSAPLRLMVLGAPGSGKTSFTTAFFRLVTNVAPEVAGVVLVTGSAEGGCGPAIAKDFMGQTARVVLTQDKSNAVYREIKSGGAWFIGRDEADRHEKEYAGDMVTGSGVRGFVQAVHAPDLKTFLETKQSGILVKKHTSTVDRRTAQKQGGSKLRVDPQQVNATLIMQLGYSDNARTVGVYYDPREAVGALLNGRQTPMRLCWVVGGSAKHRDMLVPDIAAGATRGERMHDADGGEWSDPEYMSDDDGRTPPRTPVNVWLPYGY
eukprot:TRINITY_DN2751_c0_g4_i1.p1 TRINITY_DN2751_c0_g4~~TRINITY_DN2751_c0_g4_i1.p1  ORF type:complete len:640 (+),score=126.14 TRINITY_DN2751_c0_g4_i1:418-2337(+)